MISYIKGKLTEIEQEAIVVESGGLGILIRVPVSVIDRLPPLGNEVMIHTYFKVSEDAMTLYGFNSKSDLEIFKQLIAVSGVGPKGALAIISTLSPDALRLAIISADAKAIARAPGIGAKSAGRIILELKGKVDLNYIPGMEDESSDKGSVSGNASSEAVQALISLGYSSSDAYKAVKSCGADESMDPEAVLKLALRKLAFM